MTLKTSEFGAVLAAARQICRKEENQNNQVKIWTSWMNQNLDLYQSYKNVLQLQISIFQEILQHLDAATDEWGIRVERVEVRVLLHS